MNSKRSIPVLSAAVGTIIGLYVLHAVFRSGRIGINTMLALLFVPAAVLCFFRVIVSVPRWWAGEIPRRLRLIPLYCTAFTAGLAFGIGVGALVTPAVSFGIPEEALQGISGVVLEDPRVVSGGRAMAALSLRESSGLNSGSNGRVRVSARGEITVFFPEESAGRLKEFGRGSLVFAEGTLRKMQEQPGRSPYLFSAESVHIVRRASALERLRTTVRLALVRRFERYDSGTASWGALALALLLGIRDNLDSGLAARYRDAGCSYVLALSGMHLAVLAGLISVLLKKPLGLRYSALAGSLIIILYCCMVGPLPSLNRAALMYLLGVLSVLGMLKRDALSLLAMAFLIQIAVTPQSGFALSFMLSYLALAGIVLSGESLALLFRGNIPPVLLQPLSASLGAFLATAGVSAWLFGILRPVGIITGLVLVPLTTVFMIGALLWLVLAGILPAWSDLLSQPLSLVYNLMEKTVFISAPVPGIQAQVHTVVWLSTALMLGITGTGWYVSRRRTRLEAFE